MERGWLGNRGRQSILQLTVTKKGFVASLGAVHSRDCTFSWIGAPIVEEPASSVLAPTASVVAAFIGNHIVSPSEVPALIATVSKAFADLGAPEPAAPAAMRLTPGQIRKSITPDALISFEDGKGYKTLKRHLTTRGMTVAEYKSKWGLPSNYPTTSPTYSAKRSAMAKSIGLGSGFRKAGKVGPVTAPRRGPAPASGPARRGRPRKAPS